MELIWSSYGLQVEFEYIYDQSTTLSTWLKYAFEAGFRVVSEVSLVPDI
jgi:hypothetical protein